MERIDKTKLTWVLKKRSITVYDNLQATKYYSMGLPSQKMLEKVKNVLRESDVDEYNTWADAITLMTRHGFRGYGANRPKD